MYSIVFREGVNMNFMNSHTRKSIGLDYIFNKLTMKTPFGIEKKNSLQPFLRGDEEKLQGELENIEQMLDLKERYLDELNELDFILHNFKEIRTSLKRVENDIVLDEVELFEIKNFVYNIKDTYNVLNRVQGVPESLIPNRDLELEELLDPEGMDSRTFYIYDTYSQSLRAIRIEKRELQRAYDSERKRLVKHVEEEIGFNLKLNGEVTIPKAQIDTIKKAVECEHLTEEASTVLYRTYRLKKSEKLELLSNKIEEIKTREEEEEYSIRKNLTSQIKNNIDIIKGQINAIASLDLILSKVDFAIKSNSTKPEIVNVPIMQIANGRHLKLEEILEHKGKSFTPVNCSLRQGVTVITGANMGGKTVRLKLIGMLQAMVQYGLYVPADSFKTSLLDYIYFSIGDMQSIDSGLSTFGGEIAGVIDIMNRSNQRGLILVDELARGTNPEEGYAISRAIVRYLKDKSSITLFTTHFSGISGERGVVHLRVKGLKRVDFDILKDEINSNVGAMSLVQEYMDYTLEEVEDEDDVPRDAINIARLMGLNENILKWAEDILFLEGR